MYLPYTVIDYAWWSELIIPAASSGRTKHALSRHSELQEIPGDGNVPAAFASLQDVGLFVAKIIADPRTLNTKVFAYTDVLTANQVYDIMEDMSGEKVIRKYVSRSALSAKNPVLTGFTAERRDTREDSSGRR